ncbi:uncharacterized protein PGTG_18619 [Puccinia graminis f. sp. tritici CRL 75-36-700-3]|uniref:Uncharacterized protein n=1 Tax=Puccinia graminis f. sp. tritici (strain CRL 75-36-700-3 / race SCCL) TaxID=418459 RepID=E3L7U5_PUCGT|nr:uncharacterized protein PGTG_18619 [Puccinia graminis f. sp. tritici CRL 75-36-700-3]EFP92620.2 hypothetical protein PGTG_18619 [Puccinia graminis f. sp. tritici CRL 75-36-700-3]
MEYPEAELADDREEEERETEGEALAVLALPLVADVTAGKFCLAAFVHGGALVALPTLDADDLRCGGHLKQEARCEENDNEPAHGCVVWRGEGGSTIAVGLDLATGGEW